MNVRDSIQSEWPMIFDFVDFRIYTQNGVNIYFIFMILYFAMRTMMFLFRKPTIPPKKYKETSDSTSEDEPVEPILAYVSPKRPRTHSRPRR
jgi:hypothetical protein